MLKWFKIGSPRGEYTMNGDFVGKWLDDLKKFWLNKDIESAISLFKNTAFYQETPFMDPYTTLEDTYMKNGMNYLEIIGFQKKEKNFTKKEKNM